MDTLKTALKWGLIIAVPGMVGLTALMYADKYFFVPLVYFMSTLGVLLFLRPYRQRRGGRATFGQLLGICFLSVFLAGIYNIAYAHIFKTFFFAARWQVFLDHYTLQLRQMGADAGASPDQLEFSVATARKQLENPVYTIGMRLMMFSVFGVVVGLLGAAVFRREEQ
jgi:Protein of unknown function (DUF4199)